MSLSATIVFLEQRDTHKFTCWFTKHRHHPCNIFFVLCNLLFCGSIPIKFLCFATVNLFFHSSIQRGILFLFVLSQWHILFWIVNLFCHVKLATTLVLNCMVVKFTTFNYRQKFLLFQIDFNKYSTATMTPQSNKLCSARMLLGVGMVVPTTFHVKRSKAQEVQRLPCNL